tara:strand:- start:18 stop:605 length:588 start_codon:yes stop_codon:yes gene_type:complete
MEKVLIFEKEVAAFFGAPFGVATDCCTHALELCLRRENPTQIKVPSRTYISVPFLASKLDIAFSWTDSPWVDFYYLTETIIDAAVLWKKKSYIPQTFMCLSFQFQKHLSLGRGGMILTDDERAAKELKKMSYDGRNPNTPWRDQNISSLGYHYYMTPETAIKGSQKLAKAIKTKPRQWHLTDWPDLRKMKVFNNE